MNKFIIAILVALKLDLVLSSDTLRFLILADWGKG